MFIKLECNGYYWTWAGFWMNHGPLLLIHHVSVEFETTGYAEKNIIPMTDPWVRDCIFAY